MQGMDAFLANLQRLQAAALDPAGVAAVKAGLQPIYDRSQGYVPVDTSTLKASGQVVEPEVEGATVAGAVSYGNEDTVTTWKNVGYEIFVEFGTSHKTYEIPSNPFLETATAESVPEIAEAMGAAFATAMEGVL